MNFAKKFIQVNSIERMLFGESVFNEDYSIRIRTGPIIYNTDFVYPEKKQVLLFSVD
jgi:hypothetical protein